MNLLHNMSCPPRTEVVLQGRPVSPQVVTFELCRALVDADYLLEEDFPGNYRQITDAAEMRATARDAIRRKWRTPAGLFAIIGEPQYPDVTADFLIGWRPLPQHYELSHLPCANPRLCAGVFARCAGTLYLSRRAPDLTWERLLDEPVAFDDPLPTRPEPPALTQRWGWRNLASAFRVP